MAHSKRGIEHASGIVAMAVVDLNLEYVSFGNDVVISPEQRPILDEEVVKEYDASVADVLMSNPHSIFHLYEFEARTKFLDRIPRENTENCREMKTRFLCCRYVICAIDDFIYKCKNIELIAIRINGDIYIGANKALDLFANKRRCQMAAFSGLNFAKMVTRDPDPMMEKHYSVVKKLRIENGQKHEAMSIFISSIARAFDNAGNVVELKTVNSKAVRKVQNLAGDKARNWWLRALLSGADRIVYGHMNGLKVEEIHEAHISDFTEGHFQFNSSRLFCEVYKLFDKIDKTLVEENSICLVNSKNGPGLLTVCSTSKESLKRSPFW